MPARTVARISDMDVQSLYPMNISFRYFSLEKFFESCAKTGLHNAEIWLCPQHFLINGQFSEDPSKLKALMREYGVQIKCLCGEQNNPKPNNMAARGELLVANTRSYFRRVIDLAEAIGCPKVLVTPGWNYFDEKVEEARVRSIDMLRELSVYAHARGVTLVLESIWSISSQIAPTIAQIANIKDAVNSDSLKLTLDLGAMSDAGETVDDWFSAFGSDIAHCHFVDGTPTGHMPWGHGNLAMRGILASFKKAGYKGGFSLEYVHPMSFQDPAGYLAETKALFEKCLQTI